MFQEGRKHSAVLLTCIKRSSVLKPYFCFLFEWPLNFQVLRTSTFPITNCSRPREIFIIIAKSEYHMTVMREHMGMPICVPGD